MPMAGRRHTFLFTDLVGFTALADSQGDDRAADVALEFYERVRPLLGRRCAEEIKAIGDALMIRCDEPAEAVRLGLEIVETLEAVEGFPPVRVGMHTGSAVSRAGDWYGTTVNVAARLCAAAAGGEVLVGDTTAEAAGRLKTAALGEPHLHWLKNVTQPVGARLASSRRHRCPVEGRLRKLKELLPTGPQEALP
jgi:adenylate cyclase